MRQRTLLRSPVAAESIRVNRRPALATHTPVPERGGDALRDGGWDFSGMPVRSDPPLRIQAKLTVGQTDDPAEQEADRIADQVMRMPEPQAQREGRPGPSLSPATGPSLVPAKRDIGSFAPIQTKSLGASDSAGFQAPPIVHDVLRSPGHPLDAATRAFFEPRFGRDLSQVQVHDDAKAAQSADATGAHAYTAGHHIAFAAGRSGDRGLLAHELAHAAQQQDRAGPVVQQKAARKTQQIDTKKDETEALKDKLKPIGVDFLQDWHVAMGLGMNSMPEPQDPEANKYWYIALAGNLAWAATSLMGSGLLSVMTSFVGAAVGSGAIQKATDTTTLPTIKTQIALRLGKARDTMQNDALPKIIAKAADQIQASKGKITPGDYEVFLWKIMFPKVDFPTRNEALTAEAIKKTQVALDDFVAQYQKWREAISNNIAKKRLANARYIPMFAGEGAIGATGGYLLSPTQKWELKEAEQEIPFKPSLKF